MTTIRLSFLLSTLLACLMLDPATRTQPADVSVEELTHQPHRMLVLTDIEADPDDTQSLVRLLLYSNVIDIEGLAATTSVHMKTRVNPESIRKVIRALRRAADDAGTAVSDDQRLRRVESPTGKRKLS